MMNGKPDRNLWWSPTLNPEAAVLKTGRPGGIRTPDPRFRKPFPEWLATSDQRVTVHLSRAGVRRYGSFTHLFAHLGAMA